jgi:antitoxin component of RelBE/YafQ-DinJ toxin-antitoxin module
MGQSFSFRKSERWKVLQLPHIAVERGNRAYYLDGWEDAMPQSNLTVLIGDDLKTKGEKLILKDGLDWSTAISAFVAHSVKLGKFPFRFIMNLMMTQIFRCITPPKILSGMCLTLFLEMKRHSLGRT